MQKNVTGQKVALQAWIPSTGLPKTGDAANITFYVQKDFGSVTALADTLPTESSSTNAKGVYYCDLTQAETNFDVANFTAKSSTSDVTITAWLNVYSTAANYNALVIDSSGRIDASKLAGQTITAAAGVTFPATIASPSNITIVGSVTGSVGSVVAEVSADVQSVNGTALSGSGTSSDPWGPA